MNPQKELIHFTQSERGFSANDKIKIIVFASGVKKAAYVRLKIDGKNLDSKAHFERHLKDCCSVFISSRPKTYEEIESVKKNKVVWQPAGIWFGYDIFADTKTRDLFLKYKQLKHDDRHSSADRIAAKIYGYPSCCQKQYTKEHGLDYIRKNYTYYEFYRKVHDLAKKFPFVFHTPCSVACSHTKAMNDKHEKIVQKTASKFYKSFASSETFRTEVIVDSLSDIFDENNKSIWKQKDGYEFSLVTKNRIRGNYYMLSHLVRKELERGTVYQARIVVRNDSSDIWLGRKKGKIDDLHHRRRFCLP